MSVVEKFLGTESTLMMIEAKNGKAISTYSSIPEEAEILLNMATRVNVKDKPLKKGSLTVIHLVEVVDDQKAETVQSTYAHV